jgi:heterodisulfide reductase subunit A-like polyferredoxin/coenzyme F420-reducing hydrogenase delta subunit
MKLGVFFSKCDGSVDSVIDLETLSKEFAFANTVKIFDNFYNPEDFDALMDEVVGHGLDAVILAGDSPMLYQKVRNGDFLLKSLSKKGVNTNRIGLVNLKNMVALPHDGDPADLHNKAKLLTDVAVEKVRCSREIEMREITPRKAVAVVGANISGLAVAQHLLDEGYKVFLINDDQTIRLPTENGDHIYPTVAYVTRHPRFHALLGTVVTDLFGFTGDYTLELVANGSKNKLKVGAAVVCLESDRRLIKEYRSVFRLDITESGYLAPRDTISARSQTLERGVFVVDYKESDNGNLSRRLLSADATAGMVINLLNRHEIFNRITVSRVDEELCSGCGACVKTCIFNAVTLSGEPPLSVIAPERCRGCGNCVAACPADARDLITYPSRFLFNAVEILARFQPRDNAPRMLLLACEGCGYRCLDSAGESGLTWPMGIMPLKVACGGQIDTQLIMHAFVHGFDFVVLLVCAEGTCHNVLGNVELERRVNLFREILRSRGIDHNRLHLINTSRSSTMAVDRIKKIYANV